MRSHRREIVLGVALGLVFGSFALAGLAERVDGIVSQPQQKDVEFSIHIVHAETGRTIYQHAADRALIPASNMKLIVTAAALKYLGAEYEFKTTVAYCGNALVVVGGGDPLLGDKATDERYGRGAGWLFEDIAAALRQEGVKEINDLVLHTSVFDDERVHPSWPREQLNRWYACEVSGINYNGNCISLTTENIDGEILVAVEPATGFVRIINNVTPIESGRGAVGAYRTSEANRLILKGRCEDKQGPFDVAIERPASFFGYLLAEHLLRAGIKMKGRIIEKPVAGSAGRRILREYTHPLSDCLARCNKNSFGLAAEALLKTIAAHAGQKGRGGSWQKGKAVVSGYLTGLGLDRSQFSVDDGSGLSRENRLSAKAVTTVLLDVRKGDNWQVYRDSLAVGGVDGTIRRYFTESEYRGKVLGKTGYIRGVKTFSGVCVTERGEYVFSILANKANGLTRAAINDIAEAIIDFADSGSDSDAGAAERSRRTARASEVGGWACVVVPPAP